MGVGVRTQRVRTIPWGTQTATTWPNPPGLIGWSGSAPSAIFGPGVPSPDRRRASRSASLSSWRIGGVWSLTIAVSPSVLMWAPSELAWRHGIDVTADELKELQYEVVLTDRVTQWLVTP